MIAEHAAGPETSAGGAAATAGADAGVSPAAAPGGASVIVVDADSGDASLPMSCPPPAFLAEKFLTDARAALADDGVLVVNCASRSEEASIAALAALQVGQNS